MAYKRILIIDIWEIVRRYEAGQTIKTISEALGYDRRTVRKYIKHLREKGVSLRDNAPVDKEEVAGLLRQITTESERPADKQALLEPYPEELKKLVTVQSLKPKTAFNVLCGRHDLTGKVSLPARSRFGEGRLHELQTVCETSRARSEPYRLTCPRIMYQCKVSDLLRHWQTEVDKILLELAVGAQNIAATEILKAIHRVMSERVVRIL